MNPEFRHNESHTTAEEKRYEAWLARVREGYGEDFGYCTPKESAAGDLFMSGCDVLAAIHELEAEFGEAA